jgi:hypothetical protein
VDNLHWIVDGIRYVAEAVNPLSTTLNDPGIHTIKVDYENPEANGLVSATIFLNAVPVPPPDTNCSAGVGACQTFGTLDATGNCTAVAGTPDDNWHTTPAPNGSWDWSCDGRTQQEFAVFAPTSPLSCEALFDGGFCASLTTSSQFCNQMSPNNVGDFYFPCVGADIVCGEPILHQQCWFSASKNTCEAGANESLLLGCK